MKKLLFVLMLGVTSCGNVTNGDSKSDSIAVDSAVVDSVNTDGTINVYFPPNRDSIFTRISNQICNSIG